MDTFWHWQAQGGPLTLVVLSILFALGFVLVVLWLALPFALFGTKRLLREILEEQRETNRQIQTLKHSLEGRAEGSSKDPLAIDWDQ